MRFLSLFTGIGGFDLGLERAGHECAGQVEIDPFCGRVLAERFNSPRWTDVRERQGDRDEHPALRANESQGGADIPGRIDLLCGGFPCQDLSVAGKRAGLAGERSGLFWEFVRIAKATRPAWGLVENVPGLLSSNRGRDFWLVLNGLRECWPVVGYRILDSRYFGVAQRRRRVFLVGGPTEAGVRAVLFEPESGGGDSQEGREAGAGVAVTLTGGSGVTSNDPGRRREHDVNLVVAHALDACRTRTGRLDPNGQDFVVGATLNSGGNDGGFRTEPGEHLVAHSLRAEGHDAGEDGTGRGTPIAPVLRGFGHGWQGQHNDDVSKVGLVRRLTTLECERLQGFPDGWTCLCQPLASYQADPDEASMRCTCPDSPRYRALGNAVTVSVAEWIGRRLRQVAA